jgi:hypothetical protein
MAEPKLAGYPLFAEEWELYLNEQIWGVANGYYREPPRPWQQANSTAAPASSGDPGAAKGEE